jgi:hypothetical protein
MRRRFAAAFLVVTGCGEREPPPPARVEVAAPAPAGPTAMTPDELAETRRKSGFQDSAALAEERAAARERVARVYVRSQLASYRAVVKQLRLSADEIDRAARRWLKAGDPQRAYDRWRGGFRRRSEKITISYQRLDDDGLDGGQAQLLLAQAYRRWEDLKEDLGGEVADDQRFAGLVAGLREALDEVARLLDDIEHDEELAAG